MIYSWKVAKTFSDHTGSVMKGLLSLFNGFGWSWKTFSDHPKTGIDTEHHADDKHFFTHPKMGKIRKLNIKLKI